MKESELLVLILFQILYIHSSFEFEKKMKNVTKVNAKIYSNIKSCHFVWAEEHLIDIQKSICWAH